MNNKGFSMIELLGVIVIIGILFAVALPAVTKYIGKTRNRAYDNIYESAYSAAQGKYMNDLQTGNTEYNIKDLYDQGLLKYQNIHLKLNLTVLMSVENIILEKNLQTMVKKLTVNYLNN